MTNITANIVANGRPIIPDGMALSWYDIRSDEFVFVDPFVGYYRYVDGVSTKFIMGKDFDKYVSIDTLLALGYEHVQPKNKSEVIRG